MSAEQPLVLLLDDSPDIVKRIQCSGAAQPVQFQLAPGFRQLLELLRAGVGECVVLNMNAARQNGMESLASITTQLPEIPVIALLPEPQVKLIPDALLHGAYDAVAITVSPSELAVRIDRAVAFRMVCRERDRLSSELRRCLGPISMIAISPPMRSLMSKVQVATENMVPILILSEPGNGRERIARSVHFNSIRHGHPFLSISCGSFSARDLDVELFGMNRKGLPPGFEFRAGLLETARGGTLYLAGVDRLSQNVQAKLAAALTSSEIQRSGDEKRIPIDVRLIASAPPDIPLKGKNSPFLPELAGLLSKQVLAIPPLRERPEDVVPLAHFFVHNKGHLASVPVQRLAPDALRRLQAYTWPGNVRELEEVMETALRSARGPVLESADLLLPGEGSNLGPFADAKQRLINRFEIDYMVSLLRYVRGNVSRAADIAQKDRSDLYTLIRKHKIDVDQFR